MSDPRLAVLRADIATAAVGAQEWRQLLEDCLDDLAECGAHGMTRGEINLFIDHWADQTGTTP